MSPQLVNDTGCLREIALDVGTIKPDEGYKAQAVLYRAVALASDGKPTKWVESMPATSAGGRINPDLRRWRHNIPTND